MLHTLTLAARITLDPRPGAAEREDRALDYLCTRLARTRVLTAEEIRMHMLVTASDIRNRGYIQ